MAFPTRIRFGVKLAVTVTVAVTVMVRVRVRNFRNLISAAHKTCLYFTSFK